jgi:YfiH family protein
VAFREVGAAEDYARVAEVMGVNARNLVRVVQVHGRGVMTVSPGDVVTDRTPADAIVSADPDRAVMVRVADCVPILLADRRKRAVAAIHAGWRGTASGVSQAAVEAMCELGVHPDEIVAAIGPGIGPCCYQVDRPVLEQCLARFSEAESWFAPDGANRWKLDLWQANRAQLTNAGVDDDAIQTAGICTADNTDRCFSFRREGANAGRMAAAIRLTG